MSCQGHRVPIVVRTIPILEAGQVVGAMEIFSDNVERHDVIKSLEEFRNAALNDPLATTSEMKCCVWYHGPSSMPSGRQMWSAAGAARNSWLFFQEWTKKP